MKRFILLSIFLLLAMRAYAVEAPVRNEASVWSGESEADADSGMTRGLMLSADLTDEEVLTEAEEVITFPYTFAPVPGVTVVRQENSTDKVEAKTGERLIQGNVEARVGPFEIIDNNEKRFRLVQDTKNAPTLLQLQGRLVVLGRLSGEIFGEVDGARGRYLGEIYIDLSRLGLVNFFRRDWLWFSFDYDYLHGETMELTGSTNALRLSQFEFVPTHLRLKPAGLYFDAYLKDAIGNLQVMLRDFQVALDGPKNKEATVNITFLGTRLTGVRCEFEDKFLRLYFRSALFLGKENDIIVEVDEEGRFRFLNSFSLPSGNEISLKGWFYHQTNAYKGGGEIRLKKGDAVVAELSCPEVWIMAQGTLEGSAKLELGEIPYFVPTAETVFFSMNRDGNFLFTNPVVVVESTPAAEPISVAGEEILQGDMMPEPTPASSASINAVTAMAQGAAETPDSSSRAH